ncbi:MAG TPA: hypothetical protein VKK79_13950 [Candidatus Lokiarchaeia archaeon]|nr:hypothetical protein [Candidatus Lokiarchaeia archaeon]
MSTNGICCQHGCWIKPEEKWRISGGIEEIAEYLRDRPELPFWRSTRGKWTYVDTKMEDGEYHTKNEFPNSDVKRCIFNMTNGGCAIHAYCLDRGIPWETFKFNICVTWPLDIQLYDPDGKGERWNIWLFNQLNDSEWDDCPCIRPDKLPPETRDKRPLAIESQKNTIISRLGPERYAQLVEFAKTYKPD